MRMSRKEKINFCLNCTSENCSGDYPHCEAFSNKARKEKTALRELGFGNATKEICRLASLGYNRKEISDICKTTTSSVNTLLRYGVKKGIITQEIMQGSLTPRNNKMSEASQ